MQQPTFTIITICFNNLQCLQKTCTSVDAQTHPPFEHWIINGSTTDDIAIWLQNIPQPPYRKYLNEIDDGISHAINKGITHSTNNIIHLLHAADTYASSAVLEKVANVWQQHPTLGWSSGKVCLVRGEQFVTVGKPFVKSKLYRGMRSVLHPSWFVHKRVYEKYGNYNLKYKIAMDYDMMCRIANEPYFFIDETIVTFDNSGISSTNYIRSLRESKTVYESHFGFSLIGNIWQIRLRLLHILLQTKLGKWLFNLKKRIGLENL